VADIVSKYDLNPTLPMFFADGVCGPELASVVKFPDWRRHRLKSFALIQAVSVSPSRPACAEA
jgi:hypothetical protein